MYIKGLTEDNNEKLGDINQKFGTIIGDFDLEQNTWPVLIEGKQHNISYLNFEVCHIKRDYTATITGLKQRLDLNGRKCIVQNFNNVTKRWFVKLDQKEIYLKPENLSVYAANTEQQYDPEQILQKI